MILNKHNFMDYARLHYDDVLFFDDELKLDLNRISFIMRAISKWKKGAELNLRLIINNIVILHNVFGTQAAMVMLFYKLNDHWDVLKAIYEWMDLLPETMEVGDMGIINFRHLESNREITKRLREI